MRSGPSALCSTCCGPTIGVCISCTVNLTKNDLHAAGILSPKMGEERKRGGVKRLEVVVVKVTQICMQVFDCLASGICSRFKGKNKR